MKYFTAQNWKKKMSMQHRDLSEKAFCKSSSASMFLIAQSSANSSETISSGFECL